MLTIRSVQVGRSCAAWIRLSAATLAWEFDAIAIQSRAPSPPARTPLALEEKALLIYQAMSNSDNIVLLLEREVTAAGDDAVIIAVNSAFRRASGYSRQQLRGRRVTCLFPNENDADKLRSAVRGAGSLRSELACVRADGSTFVMGLHLMPAPERTEGTACFAILGRDITAVVEARQMGDSIQRLLAKVFSSVDVAVAIVNAAGRIVMTNPRIDHLLGYKPNGLVGRDCLDMLAPGSRAAIAETIRQQFEHETDATYCTSVLRADGSMLAVRITSVVATMAEAKKFRIITMQPDAVATTRIRTENVGRIKLVGLDGVRSALGDRWPAVAERAMAAAEVVIKRHCGPQDSFSRVDDTTWLICFGTLNEEEACFTAAMIGREIRSRLIGEGEDPERAYVHAIAAVVRFPDQGETDDALQAILLEGLDQQLEQIEQDARQALHDAVSSAACKVVPIYGRNPEHVVASQVLIPHSLERRLISALAALPRLESASFDPDGFLVALAAHHAVSSMATGDITPLLVKVSFDIFATRVATERFCAMCAKIDRRVTNRLVFLLSSLPGGVPRTRLQTCVNRLRPFCCGVGYQVDQVADLPEIDMSTSFNPIVALPATACSTSTPGKLRGVFTALQARRARILIRMVGSEKDASVLRSVGADMIAMKHSEA